jgi:SAM-dependent methyltransferase
MYRELAQFFHLVTSPEEYGTEAELYGRLLRECAQVPVRSVLELGSGGGNNAWHLKALFELTLVDLSDEMLQLSRSLNPECEHIQGDMRTLRLGRGFDAVFVHDAIDYMTTPTDLRAAIETAFVHCVPGGVAVFAPDHAKETLATTTEHGGHDATDRSLRYLEWTWDPDPSDDTYVVDFAYLLRERGGEVHVEHDRHVCGAFPRATWLHLLEGAGFSARIRTGIAGETAPDIFVGLRPPDL